MDQRETVIVLLLAGVVRLPAACGAFADFEAAIEEFVPIDYEQECRATAETAQP